MSTIFLEYSESVSRMFHGYACETLARTSDCSRLNLAESGNECRSRKLNATSLRPRFHLTMILHDIATSERRKTNNADAPRNVISRKLEQIAAGERFLETSELQTRNVIDRPRKKGIKRSGCLTTVSFTRIPRSECMYVAWNCGQFRSNVKYWNATVFSFFFPSYI